jgi:hypothetical protein
MRKNVENFFLLASCQPLIRKAGSGSVRQWYGSSDPDPRVKMPRVHNSASLQVNSLSYTIRVGCAGILQGRVSLPAGLLQDGHGAKSEDHSACGESSHCLAMYHRPTIVGFPVRYVP